MADDVAICNMALVSIGHTKFIGALTERSEEARVCAVEYPQARDEVLEKGRLFTRRTTPAQLDGTTLDGGAVPAEWTYAYAVPADCIVTGLERVSVGSRNLRPDQEPPFKVAYDGKLQALVIYSDEPAPVFVYPVRVEDAELFSPLLARAIAERLAVPLLRGLRKDLKLIPLQEQKAASALGEAVASRKGSEKPDETPAPSWIAGR